MAHTRIYGCEKSAILKQTEKSAAITSDVAAGPVGGRPAGGYLCATFPPHSSPRRKAPIGARPVLVAGRRKTHLAAGIATSPL